MVKSSFLIFILLNVNISLCQNFNIDTIVVDGVLITLTNRCDFKVSNKNAIPMDIVNGYYFFVKNNFNGDQKSKYESLFSLDKNQNAIFIFENEGVKSFSTLNAYFFNDTLKAAQLGKSLFATNKSYSYKDKKYFYKCVPIRIKCLSFSMSEKELIHFIPFEQYNFNYDKIQVNIVQQIVN